MDLEEFKKQVLSTPVSKEERIMQSIVSSTPEFHDADGEIDPLKIGVGTRLLVDHLAKVYLSPDFEWYEQPRHPPCRFTNIGNICGFVTSDFNPKSLAFSPDLFRWQFWRILADWYEERGERQKSDEIKFLIRFLAWDIFPNFGNIEVPPYHWGTEFTATFERGRPIDIPNVVISELTERYYGSWRDVHAVDVFTWNYANLKKRVRPWNIYKYRALLAPMSDWVHTPRYLGETIDKLYRTVSEAYAGIEAICKLPIPYL